MKETGTITWWGAAGVELAFGGRVLLVDPYLQPHEARAHYICVTRENYDHCHEPTLERLVRGSAFERMLVAPACPLMSKLDTPTGRDPRDLEFVDPARVTVMWPKYARKPTYKQKDTTEIALDGFHVTAVESSESDPVNVLGSELFGKRYKPANGPDWPAATGAYVGVGELPALGFVITEMTSGLTFYHPGDLQEAYDSQRELRGQIDFMFLPMATLEGVELSVVDNVRPRFVIPIHYRLSTPDFPIPLNIGSQGLTTTNLHYGRPRPWAAPDVYRQEIHAMMDAHWYSTPPAPLERIAEITLDLRELGAEVIVLPAGRPYTPVPKNSVGEMRVRGTS